MEIGGRSLSGVAPPGWEEGLATTRGLFSRRSRRPVFSFHKGASDSALLLEVHAKDKHGSQPHRLAGCRCSEYSRVHRYSRYYVVLRPRLNHNWLFYSEWGAAEWPRQPSNPILHRLESWALSHALLIITKLMIR